MVVVPKPHVSSSSPCEWQELYPAARLMIADENNFHTENRRRFVSRVALSDLDGVIITHSVQAARPGPRVQGQDHPGAARLHARRAEEAKEEGERTPREADPARIETFEQKLQAALSSEGRGPQRAVRRARGRPAVVDEAHEFRKLDFATAAPDQGHPARGSDRAMDLYIKSRYLEEKHLAARW